MICPVCLRAGKTKFCPVCGVWMSDGFDHPDEDDENDIDYESTEAMPLQAGGSA